QSIKRKVLLGFILVIVLKPVHAKATGICLYPMHKTSNEILAHTGLLTNQNNKKKRSITIK
ncbi:hypothetical protein ABTM75_19985, partial [Acinetobacter baumannii]